MRLRTQPIPRVGEMIHVTLNGRCYPAVTTAVDRIDDSVDAWTALDGSDSWQEFSVDACAFIASVGVGLLYLNKMQEDNGLSQRRRIFGMDKTYHTLADCDD